MPDAVYVTAEYIKVCYFAKPEKYGASRTCVRVDKGLLICYCYSMAVNTWFEDSRKQVRLIFDDDFDVFCKLLAGMSPISTLESNVAEAIKAYRQIKWYGSLIRNTFIYSRYSVTNKLLNNQSTTRKVQAMYQNLVGNENVIAIDRWLLRYFGYTEAMIIRGIYKNSDYDKLEDIIKYEAEKLSVTPAQRQVQIWCAMRKDDTSYGDVLKKKEISKQNILNRLL